MLKSRLASELRLRQIKLGKVSQQVVCALTDDEIIQSYTTCSCCGQKQIDGEPLVSAIEKANDANHFFALCDEHATKNNFKHTASLN